MSRYRITYEVTSRHESIVEAPTPEKARLLWAQGYEEDDCEIGAGVCKFLNIDLRA